MITKTTRSYSESEKKQLLQQLPSLYQRIEEYTMLFILIMIVFLLPFLLLDKLFKFSSNVQLITCIVIITLTALVIERIKKKYGGGFSNRKDIDKLKSGLAEVIHVKTSRAIKREDPDDFGVAFYIDVTDEGTRKCLYLWGQYLDDLEGDNLFPNTEFIVTRKFDNKETIDIKLSGQPFKPEKTLPAFSKDDWKSGKVPADGDLLNTSIDDVT